MGFQDLSGSWEFRLDPERRGEREGWADRELDEPVKLPGSLDENGIGSPNDEQGYLGGLSRRFSYTGAAWFSRTAKLWPSAKTLLLERVHWFSTVWIDGERVGEGESLSVPHTFDVSRFAGRHVRLTIRVDNTPKIPIGRIGHSLSDWTQTNWNGIVGAIGVEDRIAERLPRPERTVRADGRMLRIDEQATFLRGTLECCVFPKTGYPPTDLAPWRSIMARLQDYGLNHLRFHSYCPPEAAFAAADEAGIWLQVELPLWTGKWALSSDPALLAFCRREAYRILETYGHHPSFLLFTLGNEMAFYGAEPEVEDLLRDLKRDFPAQLMNFSSHGTYLSPECDFYVQADNGKPGDANRPLRGSTWFGVGSRFDREAPNSRTTCDEASAQFGRPVIAHEVGEWAVFPDVHHADRYDGVLEARNFRAIQRQLNGHGMGDMAPAFVEASGKLSAALYKEEIETLLRTRDLAGYQLLGLTDFPGQGTATIGMLDAFWEDKGFACAAHWRGFCSDCVPLLSASKFVWTASEQFEAEALVFHHGNPRSGDLRWDLVSAGGVRVRSGCLEGVAEGRGSTSFGRVSFYLGEIESPAKLTLALTFDEAFRNQWDLWVFPDSVAPSDFGDVFVARFFRQDVVDALRADRTVWLRHEHPMPGNSIPGRFAPAFWSPIHFKEQVGTLGTLIDAGHPLFGAFPTESFSEWHWWDVLMRSRALVLNDLPRAFRPVVQVIDRYDRNHKLGTILEAQVGAGRLLVTAIDFGELERRPAARQLESSIRRYLASTDFAPQQSVSFGELGRMYRDEP